MPGSHGEGGALGVTAHYAGLVAFVCKISAVTKSLDQEGVATSADFGGRHVPFRRLTDDQSLTLAFPSE